MRTIFSTVRRDQAPADLPQPGDHAVGRQLRIGRVGESAVLDEAVRVEQQADALPGEELAGLGVLLVVLGRAALSDAGQLRLQLVVESHRGGASSRVHYFAK